MNPHCVIALLAAAGPVIAAKESSPAPWRTYEVYQPRIERHHVVNGQTQELKYNHCSSIAWFRDRWFCLWNANQPAEEGLPGQLNYMSTSRDGRTWSPPEPAFASEKRSVNPVPCPTGTQWQPNLIVLGTELWAVWSQNSRDDHKGAYVSRLKEPAGRWINRRLEWDGDPMPLVDGTRWRLFPTQNPVRLRSGRVLAPVSMIGPIAADAPQAIRDQKSFWAFEKRDSVLYTDDGGATWRVSPGAIQPARTWAQWEPTVWELPDGTVMMFARNNDFRGRPEDGPRPAEMLVWSASADGGATWTPHRYVPLETVASRMHVLPAGGNRHVMVHNDWPAGRFGLDRNNLALFFNRGAGLDFVAGPGLTDREPVVCYPQMWIRGSALHVSYSQGRHRRSIKVARVEPLPDPRRYYLFPRNNVPAPPAPVRADDAYRFAGGQHIETRAIVEPGEAAFSAGAWVCPGDSGVLFDTRNPQGRGGIVWGFAGHGADGVKPFIHLRTPEGNLTSSLTLPAGEWSYTGVSVDNRAGVVTFYVNGRADPVRFTAPAPQPLRGASGYIGAKRIPSSALAGFSGGLRALALFASARFGVEEHNGLHNAFAAALGKPPRAPAAEPAAKPALWLNPADPSACARDFMISGAVAESVQAVTVAGRKALRFTGEASAGVDLDDNDRARGDRVEFAFRFRIEKGDGHVLCTLGDADAPVRVIAKAGQVWLTSGGQTARGGDVKPDGWTRVDLTTARDTSSVRVEGGAPAAVRHPAQATWVYLGQGFRTGELPATNSFLVDVPSVRSRVGAAERHQ